MLFDGENRNLYYKLIYVPVNKFETIYFKHASIHKTITKLEAPLQYSPISALLWISSSITCQIISPCNHEELQINKQKAKLKCNEQSVIRSKSGAATIHQAYYNIDIHAS